MNAEPKPYLLPQLRDIGSGAGVGAIEGMSVGMWAGPAGVITIGFWLAVTAGSLPSDGIWVCGIVLLGSMYAALLGLVVGGVIGGITGGSIYLVLYPFLPQERWPEMETALRQGARRGAVAAQIFAAVVPVLGIGPWGSYVAGWISSSAYDFLIPAWIALVPCGFVLGAFIHVGCLMRPEESHPEEAG